MLQYNEITVGIIGAGSWGLSLAQHFGSSGIGVQVWGRKSEDLEEISQYRESRNYLPGISLSRKISVTSSIEELARNSNILVFAVPSSANRIVAESLKPFYETNIPIVSTAKGLEQNSRKRSSEVLTEVLGCNSVYVLSGPTFALEVAKGLPTAVVLASKNIKSPEHSDMVSLFHRGTLRVYSSSDMTGVELGGVLKNIISFAAGVCDGLGLGLNARAALLTRGLKEVRNILEKEGGKAETVMGLSVLGDLLLTATGDLSRNRRFGILLGEGLSIEQAKHKIGQTIETITTAQAAVDLVEKHKIESPIIRQVNLVLNGTSSPSRAFQELLTRDQKEE
jgi:glycerol-3-phosphate dehydrogenase (NAD(P)+)